jgi:NADH:ubiquinone oxidoreductase subunit 6 (subunit J)
MVAIAGHMASGGLFLLMLAMAGGVFMALDATLSRAAALIIVLAVIVSFVFLWYVLPVVVREGSRRQRENLDT